MTVCDSCSKASVGKTQGRREMKQTRQSQVHIVAVGLPLLPDAEDACCSPEGKATAEVAVGMVKVMGKALLEEDTEGCCGWGEGNEGFQEGGKVMVEVWNKHQE